MHSTKNYDPVASKAKIGIAAKFWQTQNKHECINLIYYSGGLVGVQLFPFAKDPTQ